MAISQCAHTKTVCESCGGKGVAELVSTLPFRDSDKCTADAQESTCQPQSLHVPPARCSEAEVGAQNGRWIMANGIHQVLDGHGAEQSGLLHVPRQDFCSVTAECCACLTN